MSTGAYIYKLLKKQVLIQYEWGFYAPSYGFDFFSFRVQGVLFKGTVKIAGNNHSDAFTIIFLDEFDEEVRRIRNVHENDLVDLLHANIDGTNAWRKIKQDYFQRKELKESSWLETTTFR